MKYKVETEGKDFLYSNGVELPYLNNIYSVVACSFIMPFYAFNNFDKACGILSISSAT